MAKFQAAARALDMLGRQQIAGIPTAITELFKNAHDAYADLVIVDYYHQHDLFILRDDGIGMTESDFLQRWLTIGTDSKMEGGHIGMPYVPPGKPRRPTMGEKGIGRLAVGLIGHQLLVLTRAVRDEGLQPLVAAFINWDVFSWPGIRLEDIEIPVKTFPQGEVPTNAEILSLVDDFRVSIEKLRSRVPIHAYESVLQTLAKFSLPTELRNLGKPSLEDQGFGTHFYIQPTDEMVRGDLRQDSLGTSNISRHLVGFTNTMSPHHDRPALVTKFREFKTDDQPVDIIGEGTFWGPDDFHECDHSFIGEIDQYGVFLGKIRIFDKEFERRIPLRNQLGLPTVCGPFKLSIGAVQGLPRDSMLPSADYKLFRDRLSRQAGIYIYRDDLRILPYGSNDVDWLSIEKRRSNSASHYYFSYRNLFGCVELTKQHNPKLQEKAGREGFRENRAYHEMRDLLESFLIFLASEFFRGSAQEGYYDEKRIVLNKQAQIEERRQRRKKEKQSNFIKSLVETTHQLRVGTVSEEIQTIVLRAQQLADSIGELDADEAAEALLALERSQFVRLKEVESKLTLAKPRGFALKKGETKTFEEYTFRSKSALEAELNPARRKVSEIVSNRITALGIKVDRKLRLSTTVEARIKGIKALESRERQRTIEARDGLTRKVKELLEENKTNLVSEVDDLWSEIVSSDLGSLSNEEFDDLIDTKTQALDKLEERTLGFCQLIQETIEGVDFIRNSDGSLTSTLLETETMDEQLESLRDQVEEDFELVQLGLAFDIIDHEFVDKIGMLGRSLDRIENWANSRPETRDAFRNVRASFNHLENYLVMFTPLRKRSNLKPTQITGRQVSEFLRGVFAERLKRAGIELRVTASFENHQWNGLRSVFYPAFLNLVDNAIYWTEWHPQRDNEGNAVPGVVELDYGSDGWTISDNGPGIEKFERERIFELRYFNKPGGRGLGLFITRKVLDGEDYSVKVAEESRLGGATFVISKMQDDTQ